MRYIKIILLMMMVMVISQKVPATEKEIKMDDPGYLKLFLIGEGLVIVNAYLAAENPTAYGAAGALLFPLLSSPDSNSSMHKWAGLVLAESIALYNLSIDKDKQQKSEIFRDNIIAWNIFAVAMLAMDSPFQDDNNTISLNYRPTNAGGHLLEFTYRF